MYKRLHNYLFLLPLFFLVILLAISCFLGYVFFHTTIEFLSVIIAATVFFFTWITRHLNKNNYFLFLGIAFLSVGIIDYLHTLSYIGINIIPGLTRNEPTQLWLAGRGILSFSFLAAPLFINRKTNGFPELIFYIFLTSLVLFGVFDVRIFPAAFDGSGLTAFKEYSEVLISFVFFLSGIILTRIYDKFDRKVFFLLLSAIFFNLVSEIFFTVYADAYNFSSSLGHLFKLISYVLVFHAVIVVGLTKPYNLLFRELEQADKKKDEFLSIATHELKTPITSIHAFAQILKKHLEVKKDKKNLHIAEVLEKQSNKLNELIVDLLDVSRIQSGKMELRKSKFKVQDLLDRVTLDFQHITKHKLIMEGKAEEEIYADEDRIEQILVNLISNAIKYSPKSDKIIIRSSRVKEGVRIEVQDFGLGVPPKSIDKIFDRFYRVTEGPHASISGIGLGLYISSQIIRRHGGKIGVKSKYGEGSTFYFTLPLGSR